MSELSSACFYQLNSPIKNYPWGSHTALNALFNVPNPENQPQAEIWMGVHPAGCSSVIDDGQSLLLSALIERDKGALLGKHISDKFSELPFLLKILSAEKALSIQVHPEKDKAQAGFSRQQASEILSANPDYNDANHKPELVFAITSFQAMNGFREIPQIVAHFAALELPVTLFDLASQPDNSGLKAFFLSLMNLPAMERVTAVRSLVSKAAALYPTDIAKLIANLNHQYPDDIGVFAPLFLNCITLQPGQAMFLYPGTLHAYVQGTAVEVMASSDNVLRAGLTPKKINLTELERCTNFVSTPFASLLMTPKQQDNRDCYPIPVEDFNFDVLKVSKNHNITAKTAEIVLALQGDTILRHGSGEQLHLKAGESAFIPACSEIYLVETSGLACRVYA
jgi:mannose-6-phosphate isomerase